LSKKDGGNFLTKDFTDDIYSRSEIASDVFVDHYGSEMFCNLLIVVQKPKREAFLGELSGMMTEYYQSLQENEMKRLKD